MDFSITARDRHESPKHKKDWDKIQKFYKAIADDASNTPKVFTIAPALHSGVYSNGARYNYPQRKVGDDTAITIVEINDITEIKVWEQPTDKSVDQKHCYAFQLLLEWTNGKIEILLDKDDEEDFKSRKKTIDEGIAKRALDLLKSNQPLAYAEDTLKSLQRQIDELQAGKVKAK